MDDSRILDVAGDNIKTDLSENQIEGLLRNFMDMDPQNVAPISNTGSYWNPEIDMVIIPKKVLNQERIALQNAMNIEKDDKPLNNSPEGNQAQTSKNKKAICKRFNFAYSQRNSKWKVGNEVE